MSRSFFAMLLATLTSAAAAQDKAPVLMSVTVEQASYRVGASTVTTPSAVVDDLRAMPRLDMVGIQVAQGVSQQRVDAVIAAIQASGLRARIGVVRNEIFTK